MPRKKKKPPQEMTSEEAIESLFPKRVIEEVKRELDQQEEQAKRCDTSINHDVN
ncbi:MAG: hypothetical protein WEB52_14530 [Dehalococcoidia bacterium]